MQRVATMDCDQASPSDSNVDILIVDDTPENLRVLSTTLMEKGYEVRCVISGSMALSSARVVCPSLILLDIKMPEMDGFEVCLRLKSDPHTAEIPVIFLSAIDETEDKVKAFAMGGADYITKPFQLQEVLARVDSQLALQAAKASIRQLNNELELRVQERTSQLEVANRLLTQEIAERKQIEEQLFHDAFHDALTGLPNRALFMERVERAIQRSKRQEEYLFAVLFLDLDRFKVINDSVGHLVGDQLLVAIAQRLGPCLRATDTVARLGGDEFTILLEDIHAFEEAIQIANRIQVALMQPFQLGGYEVFTTASIGVVSSTSNYDRCEDLLRNADIAMYYAKDAGGACHAVFDQNMLSGVLDRLQLETDLRQGLEREELRVYYQPIVSLKTGRLVGLEALARWQHPQRGLILPNEFIPIAEETGLIEPLGQWVLQQSCKHLQAWQTQFSTHPDLFLSVNISGRQFSQSNFIEMVDQSLKDSQVDGSCLKLEITESVLLKSPERTTAILEQLRGRNIQLCIDDFGTGYSSLSYLHHFPIHTLKIDRSFLIQMELTNKNYEIVRTIIMLGQALELDVVAEGIGTAQQLAQLRELGCALGQGSIFSQPLARQDIEDLIKQDRQW